MGTDTAGIGAEKIDRESSKEDVTSELEEKIEDEPRPGSPLPKIEHAVKETGTDPRDLENLENLETETQDPEPIKVPRSQRRGLFGRFTILAEVEEPKHYSRKAKWYITFIVALAAMAAPLGSAIIFRMAPDESITALANNPQRPSFKLHMTSILLPQSLTSQPPCICFPCPFFPFGGLHFQRP